MEFFTNCCGAEVINDYGFCPDCGEHCEVISEEDIEFAEKAEQEKLNYLNNEK